MSGSAFSVWVTGPDLEAADAIAEELARRLVARHLAVEVLDRRTPGIDALAGEGVERRVAFATGLLARHGVAVVVALPVATRAARERVRAELARMIEVYVRPAHETGGTAYEPPERPEVEITVPEPSPGAGVERQMVCGLEWWGSRRRCLTQVLLLINTRKFRSAPAISCNSLVLEEES